MPEWLAKQYATLAVHHPSLSRLRILMTKYAHAVIVSTVFAQISFFQVDFISGCKEAASVTYSSSASGLPGAMPLRDWWLLFPGDATGQGQLQATLLQHYE